MEKDLMVRGCHRLNKLLIDLINCEDRQEIIRLSNCFIDDAQELIALIYVENQITDEDVEKFKQTLIDIEKDAMKELNDGDGVGEVASVDGKDIEASTSVQEKEQKIPVDLMPHSPADDL